MYELYIIDKQVLGGDTVINIFRVGEKKNIGLLILIIILIEGAGFLSGLLGMSNIRIYENLIKPSFAPPNWIFPIVWAILYFLMAISLYRIILKGKQNNNITKALILFFIQLFLNLIWTTIFFRFNLYGLAFIEILLMLIFILLTTFEFYRHDKIASFLMIPYIAWTSFASVLNFVIWMLNEA
ncbi:TspO/MBR family protein [Clostridium thermopalmarium DSM 5974]|uniref:TspO/MBR family protein n=1 Tax=Clostridium thermopalmarium DSM 5974 TaxID=1121340 RepID=A0A2T0AS06_9CLOT|nr:TspO/MBR family protein [Clostridium thermopalmarium DSM 5974]PVZ20890.1 TspO/MBR related protein [Clostridium thermopalmarium DSM 5974]